MFIIKCLLLLFVLGQIDARLSGSQSPDRCPYPYLENGLFRTRLKSKLIKFSCFAGFELVGSKYVTCHNGEWDVPLPICVKPGCKQPSIEHGVQMPSVGGAWVIFFCMPGHKLVGSPAIFCNGRKWNDTAPTCVDTTAQTKLSCDFEDSNICGWVQDELHDFDWKRLNRKTPSSFLFTGPSFDHTFGEGGSGYYMYIESTSRLANDTARLISPIYDKSLAENGCFSFFYHMFGKTTGGLRVYQKPEKYPLQFITTMPEADKRKYILFEKWGNQGNTWFSAAPMLKDFSDSFQIVIEGIRGTSYTSDIAIDDVAILQGENCTIAQKYATTPATIMSDSCVWRCDLLGNPNKELGCGCTASCISEGDCCPDFFDLCLNYDISTTAENKDQNEMPQTQKLVASTLAETTSTSTTTSSTTTTTTPKPTTTTTTTTERPTTTPTTKATTKIMTTKKILPTLIIPTTTPVYKINVTTIKIPTKKPTTLKAKTTVKTTKKAEFTTTTTPSHPSTLDDKIKAQKEITIETKKIVAGKSKSESNGVKTTLLTITALLFCVGAVWLVIMARGERGKVALARLRGRTQRDPEVRYLNADVDDD